MLKIQLPNQAAFFIECAAFLLRLWNNEKAQFLIYMLSDWAFTIGISLTFYMLFLLLYQKFNNDNCISKAFCIILRSFLTT
jgi:hypothetical protein